jgi:hypothetical protein
LIRFFLAMLLSAIVLAGVTWIAHCQLWIHGFPSFFYQTLIFLVFATTTIFAYLYNANRPDFFVQLYLLTMVVKFLAYGAYNLFMILEDKDGASLNVVFFMIIYIVFTALEIAFLYRRITNSGPR